MALNLPPIVGGTPTSSGGAGMDKLTRILELKSRQDTLQLTREQLEQRKKELGFEETGRTLTAARAVIENTQPGSPAWKNATQHIVRAYGGDPDAITVPPEDVAKQLGAAIKKINAASLAYSQGKKTRQQLQDESSEIAVATLTGLGAYATPLDKNSAMGQAAGLLVSAAEGGQKTFQAGAQEDIATAGHAARTAETTAAMNAREDYSTTKAKERFDYGIGNTGGGGAAGKPASLPIGDIYKSFLLDDLEQQSTVTETVTDERTGVTKTTKRRVPVDEEMIARSSKNASALMSATLQAQGVLRGEADRVGAETGRRVGTYATELESPRLGALAAMADTLSEAKGDAVAGWSDTFKFFSTDDLFAEGYDAAVVKVEERLQDVEAIADARVPGWEKITGRDNATAFLGRMLEASGVADPQLRNRMIADIVGRLKGK